MTRVYQLILRYFEKCLRQIRVQMFPFDYVSADVAEINRNNYLQ